MGLSRLNGQPFILFLCLCSIVEVFIADEVCFIADDACFMTDDVFS